MKKANHRNRPYLLFVVSTFFILLFVWLLNLVNFRGEFAKPIKQGVSDFDIYDLPFSGIHQENTTRDTMIVLVQAGTTREIIARQLLLLDSLNPAVIGVDILFQGKSTEIDDFRFLRILEQLKKRPVFGYRFTSEGRHKVPVRNFFSDTGYISQEGYLDLIGDPYSAVRLYAPAVVLNKERHSSFSSRVIERAVPERSAELQRREHSQELINYSGNLDRFSFFRLEDLEMYAADGQLRPKIENKIVLLGYFKPESPLVMEDMHFTPLNERVNGRSHPDMYGIVIHANIISMVLNGTYLSQAPGWVSYLLTGIFVFLMTWLVSVIHHRFHHPLLHLGLLFLIIIVIILLTAIFLLIFSWLGVKLILLPIILGIVLSVELYEVFHWLAVKFISLIKKWNNEKIFAVFKSKSANTRKRPDQPAA